MLSSKTFLQKTKSENTVVQHQSDVTRSTTLLALGLCCRHEKALVFFLLTSHEQPRSLQVTLLFWSPSLKLAPQLAGNGLHLQPCSGLESSIEWTFGSDVFKLEIQVF